MRLALALLITLTACSEFPALEGTVSPEQANAPLPSLVPLDSLLAQSGITNSAGVTAQANLSPRMATLRARADRLRGPVIPATTRARMLRGVR